MLTMRQRAQIKSQSNTTHEEIVQNLILWASENFTTFNSKNGTSTLNFDYKAIEDQIRAEASLNSYSDEATAELVKSITAELKTLEESEGSFMKLAQIPPKPLDDPGEGMEYFYDAQSKTWSKRTKQASMVFDEPSRESVEQNQVKSTIKSSLSHYEKLGKAHEFLLKCAQDLSIEDVFGKARWEDRLGKDASAAVDTTAALEVYDKVVKAGTTHKGTVRLANTKNNNYQVKWDSGEEGTYWKSELAKLVTA